MANHPHPGGPLEPVTVKWPLPFLERVQALGRGGNRSDNIRTLAEFGLAALEQPGALDALELSNIVERLEAVTERISSGANQNSPCPSGAVWVDDTAEAAAAMKAGHALVASPEAIAVQGRDAEGELGILVLDLEGDRLTLHTTTGQEQREIDGRQLANLIDALAAGIAEVRRRAAKGSIEGKEITSRDGAVTWVIHGPSGAGIRVGKVALHWPAALTYPLMAELCALQGRWLNAKNEQLQNLAQNLAATPDESVEVAR